MLFKEQCQIILHRYNSLVKSWLEHYSSDIILQTWKTDGTTNIKICF